MDIFRWKVMDRLLSIFNPMLYLLSSHSNKISSSTANRTKEPWPTSMPSLPRQDRDNRYTKNYFFFPTSFYKNKNNSDFRIARQTTTLLTTLKM